MGYSSSKIAVIRACLGAVLSLIMAVSAQAKAGCSADRVDIRGDWGQARFTVELAETVAERNRGLMFRREMPLLSGMLFVYDKPETVSFWMRNTLIPLDMIFLRADGSVGKIHENAVPLDETPIFGGDDIQFVLEVNGGVVSRFGITPDSVLRHPAIDPAAAQWACD